MANGTDNANFCPRLNRGEVLAAKTNHLVQDGDNAAIVVHVEH